MNVGESPAERQTGASQSWKPGEKNTAPRIITGSPGWIEEAGRSPAWIENVCGREYGVFVTDQFGAIAWMNQRAVEMTGFAPHDLVGRHISKICDEGDVREGKPSEELRIAEEAGVFEGKCVRRRADGTRLIAQTTIAGIRDQVGTITGFVVIMRDLGRADSDDFAREDLKENLDEFIEENPFLLVTGLDIQGRVIYWNKAFEDLSGLTRSSVQGKKLAELLEVESETFDFERDVRKILTGRSYPVDVKWSFRRSDGKRARIRSRAFPVSDGVAGSRLFLFGIDISDEWEAYEKLERLERMHRVLRRVTLLAHSPRSERVFHEICRIIVEDAGLCMSWFGFLNRSKNQIEPVAFWGNEDGFLDSCRFSVLDIPEGRGPTGTAVREDAPSVSNDIAVELRMVPWSKEALKRGYQSVGSFPVRRGNEVVGVLTAFSDRKGFFKDETIELFNLLAELLSITVETIHLEKKWRETEEHLRKSEKHYRSLIEQGMDVIAILNPDRTVRYVSPSITRVLGYSRSQLRDTSIMKVVHPNSAYDFSRMLSEIFANPGTARKATAMFLARNGQIRHLEVIGRIFEDDFTGRGLAMCARDVTDRMEAEEELVRSERIVRAILNASDETILMIDRAGTVITVNAVGAQTIGKDVEQIIGSNINSFVDDASGSIFVSGEKVSAVFRTGKPAKYECTYRGRTYECAIYPVFEEEVVSSAAFVARDVTEQRLAWEAQKKDRDLVTAVIQASGALAFVLDAEGRIIIFNRACEKASGYTYEEVRGKCFWKELLSDEDSRTFVAVFEKILSKARFETIELMVQGKDGMKRVIECSSAFIEGQGGQVEYVVFTGIDVTDRKRAELALRESEQRYRVIFESTGTAMCTVSREGKIMFSNKEFLRIFGYSDIEIADLDSFDELVLPERREEFSGFFTGVIDGEKSSSELFECTMVSKSGETIETLMTVSFIPQREEAIVSLIDITREKAIEREIEETAERLKHFLVVAAHEIRHPVTVLKGYAGSLSGLFGRVSEETIEEILKEMNSASDRLTRYVEELMDVGIIEQGYLLIRKELFETDELRRPLLDFMNVGSGVRSLEFRVSPEASYMYADRDKVIQVLTILLDNAVKYSPAEEAIEVDVRRERRGLVVKVLDRGPGIDEEHREKVFERFYQIEDAMHHSKPGLGLGLYLAREIVRAHGGEIWCEPRDGGGTVFTFVLPDMKTGEDAESLPRLR